jgi:dolichol-phosphate mannosyltransferase
VGDVFPFATTQGAALYHRTLPEACPLIAVIVPTLNEASNIVPMVRALDIALVKYRAEIIFVDDWSTDGTAEQVESLARRRSDIRLIRRASRTGLASAVVEGMLATTAPIVAVIDADMQHDESILPAMIDAVASGEADVSIGSRYRSGGSCGEWSEHRQWASRVATRFARLSIGEDVADPLSGFFAIRRDVVTQIAPGLSQKGFKILLDILMSATRKLTVREFPYVFRNRLSGESKLSAGVMVDYARLLMVKGLRRLSHNRLAMFGLVGFSGVGVNMFVVNEAIGRMAFDKAQALGVATAIACNFFLNNAITYRDRPLRGARLLSGLASFYLACSLGALANMGVSIALFSALPKWWLASFMGTLAGSACNFLTSSALTWRSAPRKLAAERAH